MSPTTSARPAFARLVACAPRFGAIALLSAVVNLLMLNGSLYMLQVYDRVLVSRSLETLAAVTLLLVFLFAIQGSADVIRQKLLVAVGREFEAHLRAPAHAAMIRLAGLEGRNRQPIADLDTMRGFLGGLGPSAFFDLPWVPVFLLFAFMIHPAIGALSLAGAILMIVLTLVADRLTRRPGRLALDLKLQRRLRGEIERRHAETILAMGFSPALRGRNDEVGRREAIALQSASNATATLGATSRVVRQLIQSLLLGLGAYLAIKGDVSAGASLASSIMVGRCLAPIDTVIAQWRPATEARAALSRLDNALAETGDVRRTELPLPQATLSVENLAISASPNGPAVLTGLNFALSAGDVLGIMGPSGTGKSSLLRALAGTGTPLSGQVRLDGVPLHHHDRDRLGASIGYVPQQIGLFDGTIAENIARMQQGAPSADILQAAEIAGVHQLVLDLPDGYDTLVGDCAGPLSGGQRQRIALARAFFGKPFLLLLDEANAHLDPVGEVAFARAVRSARERGAIVLLSSHRPNILSLCSHVLVLGEGRQRAFGPAETILKPVAARPLRATA